MKSIIAYQILLAIASVVLFFLVGEQSPQLGSLLIGNVGGVLYCTRAIYVRHCVNDDWEDRWQLWYYLRPLASALCGFVSYFFIKLGLLALSGAKAPETTTYGFYAVAFIAGYNVDNFLKRLEELAKSKLKMKSSNLKEESE